MKSQRYEFQSVIEHIDCELKEILKKLDSNLSVKVEEIRLRSGRPLMIHSEGVDLYVDRFGNTYSEDDNLSKSYIVSTENINKTFQMVSNYSIYSIQEELKQGFVTIKGGHRIGLIGKGIYSGEKLVSIKDISSINIRISKQIIGASKHIIKHIVKGPCDIYNTLIVSPPKCGKTTILRDIIRQISSGTREYNMKGLKVGVVDERSEIAGMYNGQPQNDLGVRTDVLDGIYKYEGMMILLRSMSPDVIATDEIGSDRDITAINEAMKSGVKIIATAHGENLEDIKNKFNLKEIIDNKIFERIIILDNSKGVGTMRDVIDGVTHQSLKVKR